MHEFGYCEGILEAVEQRAAGRPVAGFTVRIGATHRIVKESLDQAFAMVATGTVAEGADIVLDVVPVTVSCGSCGRTSTSMDPLATCSGCGSPDVSVSGGDELLLESITLQPTA